MVVVGNYIGKAGMSAVSIGGDILHLLTFVAMGFSSAGQVLIARSELFPYKNKHFFLFSKSGFTKGCAEKVKEFGNVTLVTYEEIALVP